MAETKKPRIGRESSERPETRICFLSLDSSYYDKIREITGNPGEKYFWGEELAN